MKRKIFINGFSCRLPNSKNPQEFWHNLVNNIDMISDDHQRWPKGFLGIPHSLGEVSNLDKFDANFFEVHAKQAQKMDPQLRFLLEVSFEAFLDASINPFDLEGSKVGVFVGACLSDSQANQMYDLDRMTGYENTGGSLSMFANRLSFFYNFQGPSMTIDTACSSSLTAFDTAIRSLEEGRCDMAVVAGTSLVMHPGVSRGFRQLQMLGDDGRCRTFDNNATGYVRSEGIVALVLSNKDKNVRTRAKVLATGVNNDGYTSEGITFPRREAQISLLNSIYGNENISLPDVQYIEAHGTGTQAGDAQEIAAINEIFVKNTKRSSELLVGSVKSNMGHSEGASGLAGIAKVLLAMEKGVIPANLNYNKPNENITALHEGRISVVDKNKPWDGGIVGINSFAFGGTNVHVVLEGYPVKKDDAELDASQKEKSRFRLYPFSARTEEGFSRIKKDIEENNLQYQSYFQNLANIPLTQRSFRGCFIGNGTDKHQLIDHQQAMKSQSVWWVFTGMGSQWLGMGRDLLKVPLVKETLDDCAKTLNPLGVDLFELFNSEQEDLFSNPTHCFIAITSIQMALVDMLRQLGVTADGMMGHSVGEIACAYADGCLTREQAMKVAYWRGKCIEESKEAKGAMIAATITWEEAQQWAKNMNIYAACHNAGESVTLSGSAENIEAATKEMMAKGIDVKSVDSAGMAFHSPLLDGALDRFRKELEKIVPTPKPRSDKWLSTCYEELDWPVVAQKCDVEYLIQNLRAPVLFHDALSKVPADSTVIEISPHSLLRSLIIGSVKDCRYVSFARKDYEGERTFYEGVAQLYVSGVDLNWKNLFQQSSALAIPEERVLVDWDHSSSWEVASYGAFTEGGGNDKVIEIDFTKEEYVYLADHFINGKMILPGVSYLWMVWKFLAEGEQKTIDEFPIHFEDIEFKRATTFTIDKPVKLNLRYFPATSRFELSEGQQLVACGFAKKLADNLAAQPNSVNQSTTADQYLTMDDFYQEFWIRGYEYGPAFREIESMSLDGNECDVLFSGNWVTHLDCFVQACAFGSLQRITGVPISIRDFRINPAYQVKKDTTIKTYLQPYSRKLINSAITMEGLGYADFSMARENAPVKHCEHIFVPYHHNKILDERNEHEVIDYLEQTSAYGQQQALKTIDVLKKQNESLPPHLLQLENALKGIKNVNVDPQRINHLMELPNAYGLRLAKHISGKTQGLLNDPMPTILSSSDYDKFYREDLGSSYLFKSGDLEDLFSIVEENLPFGAGMNICEIGAGTGGLTVNLLPLLRFRSDRYCVTDVSAGFLHNLRNDFNNYSAVTEFFPWDINEAIESNQKGRFQIIAGSNALHASKNIRKALENIKEALADDGYLLLHEITHGVSVVGLWGFIPEFWDFEDPEDRSCGAFVGFEKWLTILEESGFDVVAYKDDGYSTSCFLCRKKKNISKSIQTISFDNSEKGFLHLQEILKDQSSSESESDLNEHREKVWIEGSDSKSSGLVGLTNCLRKEPYSKDIRVCFVEGEEGLTESQRERMQQFDLYMNVFRQGQWGSYRLRTMSDVISAQSDNYYLDIKTKGDLSTLGWTQSPDYLKDHYDYQALYLGVNFKDIMLASGKLSSQAVIAHFGQAFGMEFAGWDRQGKRVMGLICYSFSNLIDDHVPYPPQILDVPDEWSMVDAVTVPLAYITAYLGFVVRARIKAGDKVLIHTGAGGVGQAAIRVALAHGCEVFTTVGTPEKRDFIRKTFPSIPESHIGNSRDISFEQQFLEATNGLGVDVILNSLADEKLQASIRLLGRYGKFVEIGRYDMSRNTKIGMELFLKDCGFYGIGFNNIKYDNPTEVNEVVQLFEQGIKDGVVQPLPYTTFGSEQIEDAFRYMAQGKHIGKVVVEVEKEAKEPKPPLKRTVSPKFWCHPDKVYLIVGGLGGLGIELTGWLIERGAKKIILTSRKGVQTAHQKYSLKAYADLGAEVVISQRNVVDAKEAELLLKEAEQLGPVDGIFNLAMVLNDAMFINQTYEDFKTVVDTKLKGTKHLDELSRKYCKELQHFVGFSSLAGGLGNPGQANYGYGNVAMDRIIAHRREKGLPGISIQWGEIGDTGFAHRNKDKLDNVFEGAVPQKLNSLFISLEQFLLANKPIVASYAPAKKNFSNDTKSANEKNFSFEDLVVDVKSILGIPEGDDIDLEKPFIEIGMDSLMGVEIIQKLNRHYGIDLPQASLNNLSLASLKKHFQSGSVEQENVEYRFIEERDFPIIDPFSEGPIQKNVVYYFSGFIADPFEAISLYPPDENTSIFAIRYEQADSIDALSVKWLSHIESLLEKGAETIHLIGFSLGAIILQKLMSLKGFKNIQGRVTTLFISPANQSIINAMLDLNLDDKLLDTATVEEGMNILQKTPIWGDYDLIPPEHIRKQLKFLKHTELKKREEAGADYIVIPSNDQLCWPKEYAQDFAGKLIEIEGMHDIRKIQLSEFYNMK